MTSCFGIAKQYAIVFFCQKKLVPSKLQITLAVFIANCLKI